MMKAALATLFLLLTMAFAVAQQGADSTYTIRPDDVLRIQVYGEQQVNSIEIPVGEDGNISAPFVGLIKAEGKTSSQLESELTDLYKARLRLRDPKVSVTFVRYRPLTASVGGAVGRPGRFDFRRGDRILTLISLGGDPVAGAADLHRAKLHRKGSEEVIPIDLFAMLRRGDLSQNYELQDGDELEVPVDPKNQVNVLGFVQRPGRFVFQEPMTLADALSQAGGEIPLRSMMSSVRVLREQPGAPGTFIQIKSNMVRYWSQGDATQNIELQAGDFVYVPPTRSPDLNTVANTVNAAFFIQNLLRNGIFGLRLFR